MGRALKEVFLVRLPLSVAEETESQRKKMTKKKSVWHSRDTKYGQWSGSPQLLQSSPSAQEDL